MLKNPIDITPLLIFKVLDGDVDAASSLLADMLETLKQRQLPSELLLDTFIPLLQNSLSNPKAKLSLKFVKSKGKPKEPTLTKAFIAYAVLQLMKTNEHTVHEACTAVGGEKGYGVDQVKAIYYEYKEFASSLDLLMDEIWQEYIKAKNLSS